MKNLLLTILLLGLALPAQAETLNVLTTTADLKSIVEFIGADKVEVKSLGQGNQNYHFLSAKPSYMIKAKNADLFIVNGLDLEIGYVSLILEGSRNANIQPETIGYLDASEGIMPLEIPKALDRSMGDIHAEGNPHYWLDPLNMKIVATSVAGRLSKLMPSEEIYFQQNLISFHKRIDEKLHQWQQQLAAFKGENIITYHKTWVYFANRFGFEIAGELEPKPGVPPSPGHLREVIDLIRRNNIKVILNENIYKDDAARYVADQSEAMVVIAPTSVGGDRDTADYFSLMDIIVGRLNEGFKK